MNTAIITNPVLWADVPDVDVIRVGPVFYMVSTSMHSMPGCPIMKSVNLKDWEIVSYVFDTFEDTPAFRLEDGEGIYGGGSWLPRCGAGTESIMYASLPMIQTSSTSTRPGISSMDRGRVRSSRICTMTRRCCWMRTAAIM